MQTSRIHPTACVEEPELVGEGTCIWHYSHVQAGAVVGARCNLGQGVFIARGASLGCGVKVQNHVSIYGGVVIEDDVFLGPSCVLTNTLNPRTQVVRRNSPEATHIRRGATIGANATILCGLMIGRHAFIAAGAVVTRSVPDYGFVVGVPGRHQGWMSRHGHRLRPKPDEVVRCPEGNLRYHRDASGQLRCLDLDEDAPLLETVGAVPYRAACGTAAGEF